MSSAQRPDATTKYCKNCRLRLPISSDEAYSTARYCLMDGLACAALAMRFPECTKLPGPLVPGDADADRWFAGTHR
jgi:2-methylcitrate dehydratase PrpD